MIPHNNAFDQVFVSTSLILRRVALAWLLVAAGTVCAHAASASPGLERFARPGPYKVEVRREALCCDRKGKAADLYLPVSRDGREFPVVTWGNGTWASPDKYDLLLRHLASWGMAVVATRDASVARGETMRDALALLTRDGPVAPLDLNRIAAIGHSQGAGGAVNAAIADKGGISTVIAIDLPARKFCSRGDCDQIPGGLPPKTSILFLSGARDGLSKPEAVASYYDAVPAGHARARASVRGADHNDIQGQPGCGFLALGCRQGIGAFLPVITAWLVWQLGIEPASQQVFAGKDATFLSDDRLTATAFSPR
ncbi:MAG: hypothetical protein J0I79_24625 [Mesorhizobium sp.]|uniref:hypothetical protein n=1 Tax=Mesorhizobium sp. TaxID=1871066 RepID=UPI001AD2CBF0|nr:hypothetical protein [Mesorhizobium sp.]MBN9221145.1 hypothetical protein [Mesorhizobium sp.]